MTRPQQLHLAYNPRDWQALAHATHKRYSVLVLHRRAGKTVYLIQEAIFCAMQDPAKTKTGQYPNVALIYPQRGQAERVAWPLLKQFVRDIPGVKIRESHLQIIFEHNGGTITLFGTHDNQYEAMRGLRFNLACFDEFAQCVDAALPEVVRPALSDEEGELIICGTPQGRDKFYDAWVKAGERDGWSRFMLKASQSGIIADAELEENRSLLDADIYEREYECEFTAMPAGSFYANEIRELRDSDRVTTILPEGNRPVIAAMDVGIADATVIWLAQVSGTAINIFNCMVYHDTSLRDIIRELRAQPYDLTYLGVPHDMGHREQTSGDPKYLMIMDLLPGTQVEVLPIIRVEQGIFMVRQLFPQFRFDEGHCGDGVEFLASYKRKFSRDTQRFLTTPLHDAASDYADALRYLAQLLDMLAGGGGDGTGGSIDQTVVSHNRGAPVKVIGMLDG